MEKLNRAFDAAQHATVSQQLELPRQGSK
jgi:hypothetical protein